MEILTGKTEIVPTTSRWQQEIRSAFRDIESLFEYLEIDTDEVSGFVRPAHGRFGILVPRNFASRMEKGNPRDPLLLQVVSPNSAPQNGSGFHSDPVGDRAAEQEPGILQKYRGRVLLLLSGACAVHCRYCFRQHFGYPGTGSVIDQAVDVIRRDKTVSEIILSGGDPLMVADSSLADLFLRLAELPHVRRLRIHTRLPVVIPSRVTDALCQMILDSPLAVCVVVHINHAREIDTSVQTAIHRLKSAGATLLNQAVLLQGINDSYEDQFSLCEKLVDNGVIPYYLHLLDPVRGAESYPVSAADGISLIQQLRESLPGYAVPRLAKEEPGHASKTILA